MRLLRTLGPVGVRTLHAGRTGPRPLWSEEDGVTSVLARVSDAPRYEILGILVSPTPSPHHHTLPAEFALRF